VLKSIESRHGLLSERATGIYSFSHLTFQEYFTAKNILDLSNPAAQEAALRKLIEHVREKRWEEVFLLVVEGLDNADYLLRLMKERIDSIVADHSELQYFLEWVQTKSASIKVAYKPAAVRAFYCTLADVRAIPYPEHDSTDRPVSGYSIIFSNSLPRALDPALSYLNPRKLAHDLDFDRACTFTFVCACDLDLIIGFDCSLTPDHEVESQVQNSINGGKKTAIGGLKTSAKS
jgi:hypothetical protein